MRTATRLAAAAAALGAGAAVGTALAHRRWRSADDPCTSYELEGATAFKVETDDGAVLNGVIAGPDDGPVVVLAHCWTGDRRIWVPVASRLVEGGHRVVLYDHRGHGSSTLGSGAASVDRLGADLRAVLESLDLSDVVVAGHSMGGMTTQALAVGYPDVVAERVRALVLVATAPNRPVPGRLSDSVGLIGFNGGIERLLTGPAGPLVLRFIVGGSPRYGQAAITRDTFVATAPSVRRDFGLATQRFDFREALREVTVPTTVVHGTRDTLIAPRFGRAIAEAIPGSVHVKVPGAGHMLPLETPDLIADLIADHAAR